MLLSIKHSLQELMEQPNIETLEKEDFNIVMDSTIQR